MNCLKHFDLHCDTPFEIYKRELPFESELIDSPISALSEFSDAAQVCAVWSDKNKTGEENYLDFFKITDNFLSEIHRHSDICTLCTTKESLETEKVKLILAVEGSALLCKDLSRLEKLYDKGVRILLPMWAGVIEAGGGHDTDKGLTPFGKELVKECERLGIIIDTSHMSERSFWDTVSVSTAPIIASHSNSAHICPHTRNLSDIQFLTILKTGGVVGINLYPPFISPKFNKGSTPDEYINHLSKHILHFLSIGGEKALCLGADRDGFGSVDGYSALCHIGKLYDRLTACGVKDKTVKDIFFGNAKRFFEKHLPSEKGI